MCKKVLSLLLLAIFAIPYFAITAFAEDANTEEGPIYLESVINTDGTIEVKKSTIFDASQSFIPDTDQELSYKWEFGDGNSNEGVEVLHAYKEPGRYNIKLTVEDEENSSETNLEVFVYRKLVSVITDRDEAKDRIKLISDFAEKNGVFLNVIESFGSSTEFISEEILTKKMTEQASNIQKAQQIVVWTQENAGLNALSRFIKNNPDKSNFSQKTIVVLENDISSKSSRIQRQFHIINPKMLLIAKEAAIDALIETKGSEEFVETLKERGSIYEMINSESGKLRPWNFMSYFVNVLIDNGIPDNTIALLLLLPVIATVVAFMKQVVGITTFGIYTPSIITLSFLVIGMHAGLLVLLAAITIGTLARPLLRRVRMLFIPKMAIVITLVSLTLLLILIASIYLELFDAQFLSIAIFPMLILSTLVEKFVSAKSEKSYTSASVLMLETVIVALVAYFIAGGEINLGFTSFRFEFVKNMMLTYPESVFLLIIINILLGKWSGVRVMERIRFREVLRHIEE
ncbi:MAG: PKD domain-containing protein [bacterium]|nr:PKD domain-containing protein [bacterium]